jgi:hypothetical protein
VLTLVLRTHVRSDLGIVECGAHDLLRPSCDAGTDSGFRLPGFVLTSLGVVHLVELARTDCGDKVNKAVFTREL